MIIGGSTQAEETAFCVVMVDTEELLQGEHPKDRSDALRGRRCSGGKAIGGI